MLLPKLKHRTTRKQTQRKKDFRLRVLGADEGRCVWCGSSESLDPHHIEKRSQGGKDDLAFCITLCRKCHNKAEDGYREEDKYVTPKQFQITILRRLKERGQLRYGREAALEYLEQLEDRKRAFDD